MAVKEDLQTWVVDALQALGRRATVVEVSRHVWAQHEAELRTSGDLFYTWQYDIRWAAHQLRLHGVLKPAEVSPRGIWELA
jgi:hypothetical protein